MSTLLPSIAPNNIRVFRQKKQWTLQQLAEACGTTRSQIDKLEKGQRRLTVEWMVRLAKPLGCDPRDLPAGAFQGTSGGAPSEGEDLDLPILGAVFVKGQQNLQLTREPIDQTKRPSFLAHTRDAYAFYMVAQDMAPMYRPRQLLFVNPHKPPLCGCGVVVLETDGQIVVADYVGQDQGGVRVRSYAPKMKERIIPFERIAALHSIVAATEPQ